MQSINYHSTVTLYRSQSARHAIKTAIAAVLSIIIFQYFKLPHGYWSTLSAIIVMQSNIDTGSLEMTLKVGSERLVGTIIGSVVALLILFTFTMNQWQFMAVIFVIVLCFTYLTKFYDGFKLAGVTALIVLLLSDHASFTHGYAVARITEILLGVVIAVLVTVCIWPYRIADYLKKRRLARLVTVHVLFSKLNVAHDDFSWIEKKRVELAKILKEIETDLSSVKVAKKGIRGKHIEKLRLEERIVRSLRRLSASFIKLPKPYWEFKPLAESTEQLLESITAASKELAENIFQPDLAAVIEQAAERHKQAFDGFRSYRRQADVVPFNIDESYQVTNTFNALQRCSERVCDFGRMMLRK